MFKQYRKIKRLTRYTKPRRRRRYSSYPSFGRRRRQSANLGCLFAVVEILKAISDAQEMKHAIQHTPIDQLTGHQFEEYLAKLYKDLGYTVEKTSKSGDFGADLIVTLNGHRRAIQAKRYSNKVGVRAVQEIIAAQNYYKAHSVAVVTTNYFTPAAIELARANNVILIDRDGLFQLISQRDQLQNKK